MLYNKMVRYNPDPNPNPSPNLNLHPNSTPNPSPKRGGLPGAHYSTMMELPRCSHAPPTRTTPHPNPSPSPSPSPRQVGFA